MLLALAALIACAALWSGSLGVLRRAAGWPSREEMHQWWIHRGDEVSSPPARGRLTLLITGQSNAGNFGAGPARYAARGVYNVYQGRVYRAREPLLGSDALGTSPWLGVAEALLRDGRAESVVLALAARGGAPAAAWDAGQPMREALLARLRDLRAAHAEPDYVLWQQGESDDLTEPASYARSVRGVVALLREHGVTAPVLVAQATRGRSGRVVAPIREAQRALVDPAAGILPGPDTDTLGDSLRHDGLHFSAEGIAALSALWLRALAAASGNSTAERR